MCTPKVRLLLTVAQSVAANGVISPGVAPIRSAVGELRLSAFGAVGS
jgi:hypothetical protein